MIDTFLTYDVTDLKRHQTSFISSRNYVKSKCILCGEILMHNQYSKKKFSRTIHLKCLGNKNRKQNSKHTNGSRMQDYIKIRTVQIEGKPQYKLV